MMDVLCHVSRGFSCNTYLCTDRQTGESVLIDPGVSAKEILALCAERRPSRILLTHGHFDHSMAASELSHLWNVPIFAHAAEAEVLSDPAKNASALFRFAPVSFSADVLLSEGEEIAFGASVLRVLHTPGHSPGSCAYFGAGKLFSGDTLFSDGIGRTDLYGGDFEKLCDSLARLASLGGDVCVFAGHGPSFDLSRRIAQSEWKKDG